MDGEEEPVGLFFFPQKGEENPWKSHTKMYRDRTIVTAVRIELKSFTTSNSHSADALFFHDALIGGCSSFDVKLLWNWIVSKYCWKIKAILWYELVFLFCQDQLFVKLDYPNEARKSASGIIRIRRGVFVSEIFGMYNKWMVVCARRCV